MRFTTVVRLVFVFLAGGILGAALFRTKTTQAQTQKAVAVQEITPSVTGQVGMSVPSGWRVVGFSCASAGGDQAHPQCYIASVKEGN